jgi:hypothetical protein
MSEPTPVDYASIFAPEPSATTPPDDDGLHALLAVATETPAAAFDDGEAGIAPRFDGDTSQMPPEACWALQHLVTRPHLSKDNGAHWAVIVAFEDLLRSRLNELGLLLIVDHDRGYAYTKQSEDPHPRSRRLLRAKTLNLAASALLLFLYQQYMGSSDHPVVTHSEMIDHMSLYRSSGDTDEAGFVAKIETAIGTLTEVALLRRLEEGDRYLIHGVVASLLDSVQLEALRERYMAVATGANVDDEEDADA